MYVDDSSMAGPNLKNLEFERDLILKKFPGKIVLPTRYEENGKIQVWDYFGCTLRYSRDNRYMKIS